MEENKALYMSRVNTRQQALITQYLCKAQPVNTLANITLRDDDGTTDDDILKCWATYWWKSCLKNLRDLMLRLEEVWRR
ncbi:hypothetical protein Hamer_G003712 [Homarus americanus]|uniref:Uncharacterized protein n=1 Tax=Homarus americanus TaxID=6706 RepID=A0A8J5K419_HOMAM|nr:hypothetical protein Hamer_G003712 [Homarus americanus]